MDGLHDTLRLMIPITAAGGAVAFGALAAMAIAPRCGAFGRIVYRGPRGERAAPRRIALTFDDGPTADSTDRILDALREHKVPAIFFVIGSNAEREPAMLQRMHDEGHIVGNHSFDHWHYGFVGTRRYWERQISRTDEIVERAIGHRPAFFRPPMGVKTWAIAHAARRLGHTVVTWSRRAMDGVHTTPQRICERVATRATDGDVVVLHDGVEPCAHGRGRDQSATVRALPLLLSSLRQRGLEIVRLDQLIGIAAYV
jgi:peptidoglycan/xylan/chitin deacetylase (PgdA/CDA1 family)